MIPFDGSSFPVRSCSSPRSRSDLPSSPDTLRPDNGHLGLLHRSSLHDSRWRRAVAAGTLLPRSWKTSSDTGASTEACHQSPGLSHVDPRKPCLSTFESGQVPQVWRLPGGSQKPAGDCPQRTDSMPLVSQRAGDPPVQRSQHLAKERLGWKKGSRMRPPARMDRSSRTRPN